MNILFINNVKIFINKVKFLSFEQSFNVDIPDILMIISWIVLKKFYFIF